ncbi:MULTISPECIES: hypothetical protein [Myroides]|uniref:Lipoprotein n=1 Tax=Myroides albus TaxID=2562892 RepID=A0A6I3LEN4_9FLAO|nr:MULTISPECIES: hypothetical protein [Myroides]MTG96673.1 hypothetical protein [Myroides albus]MVX34685.1 hypothetical protein [Myroides sp. LoEW2-1]
MMSYKKLLFIASVSLVTLSCNDKKQESGDTTQTKEHSVKQDDKKVEIPMHGTSENSSSSSNKRFEVSNDMKQMIQQEKNK